MTEADREAIISSYITGYNTFDIPKMVEHFDDNIHFENIADGETTMSLLGLTSFKQQAIAARQYFSERTQTIQSFTHEDDRTTIEIDYEATVAEDLPNGLKKGENFAVTGRSIFEFWNGVVVKLTDIS